MPPRKKKIDPANKPTTAAELRALVNSQLGEEALEFASDEKYSVQYQRTGVLPVDIAFKGGIPKGPMTILTGDFSTLKSYIGYMTLAETQKAGGIGGLIDTEKTFDMKWAIRCGINVKELVIQRPSSGEAAIDAAEALIYGGVDTLVFDSVSAALPEAYKGNRMSGQSTQPGRLAAMMSRGLAKLTTANDRTAVLWINQLRMQIGTSFGNPEVATGGRALPFYASYIANIRKQGKITVPYEAYDSEGKVKGFGGGPQKTVGQKFKLTLEKSKLSEPYGETYFTWNLDGGEIDLTGYLIAIGQELGLIVRPNQTTWRIVGSKNLITGKDTFREFVRNNSKARAFLIRKIEEVSYRA